MARAPGEGHALPVHPGDRVCLDTGARGHVVAFYALNTHGGRAAAVPTFPGAYDIAAIGLCLDGGERFLVCPTRILANAGPVSPAGQAMTRERAAQIRARYADQVRNGTQCPIVNAETIAWLGARSAHAHLSLRHWIRRQQAALASDGTAGEQSP